MNARDRVVNGSALVHARVSQVGDVLGLLFPNSRVAARTVEEDVVLESVKPRS